MDGLRGYRESPRTLRTTTLRTPRTPRNPKTPTIEQFLQGDASRWPLSNSPPSSPTLRNHDPEEDHSHLQKKSVLTKVKEKAKRWRSSLSKKKLNSDSNSTPTWGVSLEDDEDEDEDPEYLGAPMYESEMAPEGLKEAARQHPRVVPVVSEKHALSPVTIADHDVGREIQKEKPLSPTNHNMDQVKETPITPNKIFTESLSDKIAPSCATISDATHSLASKIQGLTVSTQTEPIVADHSERQKWDKGISVKEYLMHKFEPGDDERALSKVITEAISPRKSPGEMSVVGKMRVVVTSLLRSDDSGSAAYAEAAPSAYAEARNQSTNIPVSTNPYEVTEEETHGRILQAN